MLNALFLDPAVSGGPETYLRELLPALHHEEPEARLSVATTRSGARALVADGWSEFCDVHALPCEDGQRLRRTLAEQVLLPRLARRVGAQVLHSMASVAPVRPRSPTVITLHDVTFILRSTFDRITTAGMRTIIVRAARDADVLVAVSAAARDEICSVLGLDPARFLVVPHGAGRPPRAGLPQVSSSDVRERYGLGGGRVMLCVGAKRPHKNQALLLRALPLMPPDVLLVLAGHAEPYERLLRSLARELEVADRVRFLEYVPDGDLEALWRLAGCAVFPTLGEGFGLPVLEAMSRGVAVACSDLPVLREVGGDVAHYFPPGSPEAAARAIQDAWADRRAEAAGIERASQFSWEASARGHWDAYERAVAGRAAP